MLIFVSYLRREGIRDGKSSKPQLIGFKITQHQRKKLLNTMVVLKLVQIRVETILIMDTIF